MHIAQSVPVFTCMIKVERILSCDKLGWVEICLAAESEWRDEMFCAGMFYAVSCGLRFPTNTTVDDYFRMY